MNKKLLLALVPLILASCGDDTSSSTVTGGSVDVTDMIGRVETVVPGSYKRIVCIGAGALRLYSYVGDVKLLSGVEDIDNTSLASRPVMFDGVARPYLIANEEHFKTLPSCGVGGPNAQNPETEKILSCNPDLIISEYEDVSRANSIKEAIGVPVITLSIGTKGVWDEKVSQTIALLGKVLDKNERASDLISYIDAQKQSIAEHVSSITDSNKKKAYICGLGNWGTTNHLMTSGNYEPFNIAKIDNVASDIGITGISKIEEEKFVSLGDDMDNMIFDAAAVKNIKGLYALDNAMFDTCKGWKEGKAYLQMAYNAYYTNLEISLANTWYNAKVIYPELFTDVDMKNKLDEVTLKFNGKALADEIYSKPQSFGGYQTINTEAFFKQ